MKRSTLTDKDIARSRLDITFTENKFTADISTGSVKN